MGQFDDEKLSGEYVAAVERYRKMCLAASYQALGTMVASGVELHLSEVVPIWYPRRYTTTVQVAPSRHVIFDERPPEEYIVDESITVLGPRPDALALKQQIGDRLAAQANITEQPLETQLRILRNVCPPTKFIVTQTEIIGTVTVNQQSKWVQRVERWKT